MKISFITGTRADFGKIEPVIKEFIKRGHEVSIFVTGMHHFDDFGLTRIEIVSRYPECVYEYINQNLGDPHEQVLIKTITGLSKYSELFKPDIFFVHGDRVEAFATSIYCAMKQVPIAHIEGGEVSGTIDEIYRHCNTKLSSIHFVSTNIAMKRVKLMGEESDRVFCTGSPELDTHLSPTRPSLEEVLDHYKIEFKDYGILLFHPVVSEINDTKRQITEIVEQLKNTKKNYVVIKPNNDPGYRNIMKTFNKLPLSCFKIIPSMRFKYFSRLLENAKIVIGNSSMGVREAPFFGVPSIDIGTRQTNRGSSKSIKTLDKEKILSLKDLVENQWGKKYKSDNFYGSGGSAKKIVDIVESGAVQKLSNQKFYKDYNNV